MVFEATHLTLLLAFLAGRSTTTVQFDSASAFKWQTSRYMNWKEKSHQLFTLLRIFVSFDIFYKHFWTKEYIRWFPIAGYRKYIIFVMRNFDANLLQNVDDHSKTRKLTDFRDIEG